MARFGRSRERRRDNRGGSSGSRTFEEYSKDRNESRGRYSNRETRGFGRDRQKRRGSRDRRPVEMTKVTCSECGKECEVPFKPTTDKPLFCDECFKTKGRKGSGSKDLEKINEKLDKIMKALKIE